MQSATEQPASQRPQGAVQSARRAPLLYALAALIALIGLGDAIYLTVEYLSGRSAQCMVTSGCSRVLSSPYASPGGIPLSIIGAFAYFTVFSLATLAAFGYRGVGRLFALLVALMFLVTLVLLYLQAFVIGEFCDYCLLSAFLVFSLTVITVVLRFFRPRT